VRKVLKWTGIVFGGLIGLVIVAVLVMFLVGRSQAAAAPAVAMKPYAIPTDTASIARGRHIAEAFGCAECHGPGLGGRAFPTPGILVSMAAPNLTRGQGGVGATYTADDWNRAIRHGIGKDGRKLIIMPSEAYNYFTDADFGALVAYLRTLPGVDQTFPARSVGPLGGALIAAGVFPLAADSIAHDSVGARPVVAPAANAEYGAYMVSAAGCKVCHGRDLRGLPGGGGSPPAPSLIAFMANNSADAFRTTIRTGKTPSGRELNPEFMPWRAYGKMTDVELDAVRLYILSTVK
jgi:mono/diheme cytochrome c family protein